MFSSSGHPRCRWVCFFIGTDLDKFSITALMDPLQWMGAVRMRVQTADKYIICNNPHDSSSLVFCGLKMYVFIINKPIIKTFLTCRKNISPLSIILLSSVKKVSRLNQERNLHRSSRVYKQNQSKPVLNKYVVGFWCERTTGDWLFHWRKCYHGLWTMDYGYFSQKWRFKVKSS